MEFPSLEDMIEKLKIIAEIPDIDVDKPIQQLGIDSLDLLEWVYSLEDFGTPVSEEMIANVDFSQSLREIYESVRDAVLQQAAQE